MYEYKCKIVKIVDGDTVDIDLDLGFGVWLRDERVRIMGIDTPESRTSDKVEKVFGLAAKDRLNSLLGSEAVLLSQVTKGGENMKGKFGRILGNFKTINGDNVADILMNEGHAVAYNGGDKDNVQKQHLANRQRLIDEGKIPTPEGMSSIKGAVNEFKATKPPLKVKPQPEVIAPKPTVITPTFKKKKNKKKK